MHINTKIKYLQNTFHFFSKITNWCQAEPGVVGVLPTESKRSCGKLSVGASPVKKPTVTPTGFLHWVFSKSPGISWFDLEWCRQCRLFIDCFPGFSCRSSHHCCPRCSSPQRETSLAAPKSRPEFEIWIDFGDSHSWRNHALGPVSEHQTSTWDFNILQIVAFFILFHVSPPGASTFCLPRFVTGVGPRCPRSMSLSQSWCESAASTMIHDHLANRQSML